MIWLRARVSCGPPRVPSEREDGDGECECECDSDVSGGEDRGGVEGSFAVPWCAIGTGLDVLTKVASWRMLMDWKRREDDDERRMRGMSGSHARWCTMSLSG